MRDLLSELKNKFSGTILTQEPMSAHTSWKLGGPAELFLVPQSLDDLQLALRAIHKRGQSWVALGNGSNVLVSDRGVRGVVLQLGELNAIDFHTEGKVEVQAGAQLGELIKSCGKRGLGGLEELSGIPGTLGGALLSNAGALDAEIGNFVRQVYLTDGLGAWALRKDQADFSYRSSGLEGKGVVTGALLQLKETDPTVLEGRRLKALARRKEVQKISAPHAGSVFKNPIGEKAWQLIDKVGLRGRRVGNAEISSVHCNHIVNLGGASATDVLTLIEEALQAVLAATGLQLELEVRLIGW